MMGEQYHRTVCGYKIKAFVVAIMEFIANIIMPNGCFCPDFMRRINRTFGRINVDFKKWKEIRQSIADALDVFDDLAALQMGCDVAAKYYQNQGFPVSSEDCMTMAKMLYTLKDKENLDDIPLQDFWFLALPE
jgi:pyruvate-formate lyase-activating enzyme